jgi:hypothetical protein
MNEYMFLCGMDTLSWNDNQDNNSNNVIEAKSEPKKGGELRATCQILI